MQRAFYSDSISNFLAQNNDEILGILTSNSPFDLNDLQRNTWIEQIRILKSATSDLKNGWVAFGYTIPRMGKRYSNNPQWYYLSIGVQSWFK